MSTFLWMDGIAACDSAGRTAANRSNFLRTGGITQVASPRGYAACPIGPITQPSSSRKACSVTAGSVWPCSSCPFLPIGSGCQSISSRSRAAAAFIILMHSGTTSSPISSPGRIPIFKLIPR
jgi:hypothetical protein